MYEAKEVKNSIVMTREDPDVILTGSSSLVNADPNADVIWVQ